MFWCGLKVSSVLYSLIVASSLFQIVGAEKLKERLLKSIVHKGLKEYMKDSDWLIENIAVVGLCVVGFWGMVSG